MATQETRAELEVLEEIYSEPSDALEVQCFAGATPREGSETGNGNGNGGCKGGKYLFAVRVSFNQLRFSVACTTEYPHRQAPDISLSTIPPERSYSLSQEAKDVLGKL